MAKLTDTQLVILFAAAQRQEGAVLPLPKSLKIKGAALTRTLNDLCKKGLLEEQPAAPDAKAWSESEDGRRMMLVITQAGLSAVDGGPDQKASNSTTAIKPKLKKRPGGATRKAAASGPKNKKPPQAIRQGTKQALLIDLLRRKNGATIDEAVAAMGWQRHSVRGAISGTLKKKLALAVTAKTVEGRGRVYQIVEHG